jgi:cytochrome b561
MPRRRPHYRAAAKLFHWAVAALLSIQFLLGWPMSGIEPGMMSASRRSES